MGSGNLTVTGSATGVATKPRPLVGVRVLDLTRMLPGAYATALLVGLGAEVLKVEDPRGGDGLRGAADLPVRDQGGRRVEGARRQQAGEERHPEQAPEGAHPA